jgi:hypothetical protein
MHDAAPRAHAVDAAAIMVMGGVVSLPLTEARRALEAAARHLLLFGRPDGDLTMRSRQPWGSAASRGLEKKGIPGGHHHLLVVLRQRRQA